MSEQIAVCDQKPSNIYEAFDCFKKRFLENHKSIFSDREVFTQDNLNQIIKGFVDNPDESNSTFDEKIKKQLGTDKEVHELFAHVIWLWSLFASDMRIEGKINDINKWLENQIDSNSHFLFDHGIGSTGQYHKTNKPAELIYIIRFFEKILNQSDGKIDYVQYIRDGIVDGIAPQEVKIGNTIKKVAMYNILLHLFAPDRFERIASYGHKEKIISFFESQFENLAYQENSDSDHKLAVIRAKCIEIYQDKYHRVWNDVYKNFNFNHFDFYHPDIEKLWKSDLVLEAKNMILHGAPGTGKTYAVENSIRNRLEFLNGQNANKQFKLVQFHPSYSYEDFIDGIKPAGISEQTGSMKFELVNGEFKQMCIDAFQELKTASKENREAKKFYFVADEINRAELSRVFGELLLCLEDDKRLRFQNGKLIGSKVKTQNSRLWTKEHAVVVENDGEMYFGVPENLYFIGTMNDIDRSVDSFDMALRRRFFWKQYRCDYDVVADNFRKESNVKKYIELCEALNKYISSTFNLGNSYELGHAYFLKIERINSSQINKLWDNHIAPLLKEYLRSEYPENELDTKIDEAKQKAFTLK